MNAVAIAGIVALLVIALTVWRVRRRLNRWAAESADVMWATPWTTIHPVVDDTSQAVDIDIVGATRALPLVGITANRAEVLHAGLHPVGWREVESETVTTVRWVPDEPWLCVPGTPTRLTFAFDASAATAVQVGLRFDMPVTIGGGLVSHHLRVPLRSAPALDAANLRSRLRAQAGREGVAANTLPEWSTLIAMEAELEHRRGRSATARE